MDCPECKKLHPEDRAIEEAGFTWEQLEEISTKKDWPLASKLAALLIDIGNECEQQWHRAEFWAKYYDPFTPPAAPPTSPPSKS